MNAKTIRIFGRNIVIKDLILDKDEPKLHQLKGVDFRSFYKRKAKLIGLSVCILLILVVVISLIPIYLNANRKESDLICGCLNNGKCNGKNGVCECPNGYQGLKCESFDICWNNPCINEGVCIASNETYFECSCGIKYEDSECESNSLYPCQVLLRLSNNNLAGLFSNNTIRIWSTDLSRATLFKKFNYEVKSLINFNQTSIVLGTCDYSIEIYNLLTKNLVKRIETGIECTNVLTTLTFNDETYLVSSNQTGIRLWNSSYQNNYNLDAIKPVTSLAFSQPNSILLSGLDNSDVLVWGISNYVKLSEGNFHNHYIYDLKILKNSYLASASRDKTVKIWDISDMKNVKQIAVLNGHDNTINSIVQIDDNLLASCAEDKKIFIWSLTTFKATKILEAHTSAVRKLIVTQSGDLVSASDDKTIRIWNTSTFTCTYILTNHTLGINALALLKNGSLVSGSFDKFIHIYDPISYKIIYSILDLIAIFLLEVMQNSNLAAAMSDNTIKVYETNTFKLIAILKSHLVPVSGLYAMENGDLISCSLDQTVKIWDAQSLKLKDTIMTQNGATAVVAKADTIISANDPYVLKFWTKTKLSIFKLRTLSGHSGPITALLFLNDRFVLSASKDSTIVMWDIVGFQIASKLYGHKSQVISLINLPNNRFASGSQDKTIKIWDQFYNNLFTLSAHSGGISSLAIVGNYLISASEDTTIIKWNINNDLVLKQSLTGHNQTVQSLIEFNDQKLLTCSNDYSLRLWNFIDRFYSSAAVYKQHKDFIYSVVSLNNSLIASCSKDVSIRIWNVTSNKLVKVLYSQLKTILSLVYFENLLYSGSCDKTIKVWNLSSYDVITTLRGHLDCVNVLTVFQKSYLLSGSQDSTITVWNLRKNYEILSVLRGHTGEINSIDIYNDRLIATGSNDSTIRLWQTTYTSFKSVLGHDDIILAVTLLPNEDIATGGVDGFIKIWKRSTFEYLGTLKGHENALKMLAVLKNGTLISCSYDISIAVWDTVKMVMINRFTYIHTDYIYSLVVLPNGNVVSGSQDSFMKILDKTTFETISQSKWLNTFSIAVLFDGLLAAGSREGQITIRSQNDLNVIYKNIKAHTHIIWSLAVLANGNLVSVSEDATVKIWSRDKFELLNSLTQHTAPVFYALSLKQTNYFLTGAGDDIILVWDQDTFELIDRLVGHLADIEGFVEFKDGTIVSVADDGFIKFWSRSSLNFATSLTGSNSPVHAVKFLTNGLLASASQDGTIKIWELKSNTIVSSTNAHSGAVNSLTLLSNGYLASTSEDKTAKIWDTVLFYNISTLN